MPALSERLGLKTWVTKSERSSSWPPSVGKASAVLTGRTSHRRVQHVAAIDELGMRIDIEPLPKAQLLAAELPEHVGLAAEHPGLVAFAADQALIKRRIVDREIDADVLQGLLEAARRANQAGLGPERLFGNALGPGARRREDRPK